MQEQQCFPPCLPCSIKKNRWKDSILQRNLCFYISIKRNMNPEGLQASTAKWQVAVKVNVPFSFQSSINSRLSMISFTVEQQTFVYWTWVFPVCLIYLLIIQADREMSFPFIDTFEDFKSFPVKARKKKPPGAHTWDVKDSGSGLCSDFHQRPGSESPTCQTSAWEKSTDSNYNRGDQISYNILAGFTNPMAPTTLLLKQLARGIHDFVAVYLGVWHRAFDPSTRSVPAQVAVVCRN